MPLRSIAFLLNTPGRTRVAAHACKPIQQEDRAASESKGGSFIAAAWVISIPCVCMHPHEVRAAAHPLFAHAPALSLPLLLKQLGQVDYRRMFLLFGSTSASCKRAARFYACAHAGGRARRLFG